MSHIYQPLMLIELLKEMDGKASVKDIAQAILNKDPTQIEYFSQVVKNMVGRVLTKNHEIATKDKDIYSLIGSEYLSNKEAEELIELCEQKIAEFEAKRGDTIWNHRRRGHRPISGSIRYQVLSRARGRCELCGITNEEKMLEVDHIFPKSLGGKDDLSNYQALCYSCNAAKTIKAQHKGEVSAKFKVAWADIAIMANLKVADGLKVGAKLTSDTSEVRRTLTILANRHNKNAVSLIHSASTNHFPSSII